MQCPLCAMQHLGMRIHPQGSSRGSNFCQHLSCNQKGDVACLVCNSFTLYRSANEFTSEKQAKNNAKNCAKILKAHLGLTDGSKILKAHPLCRAQQAAQPAGALGAMPFLMVVNQPMAQAYTSGCIPTTYIHIAKCNYVHVGVCTLRADLSSMKL